MSSKVTARFYVSEIAFGPGSDAAGRVKFQPAYANGANKEWAQATPSGSIELYVNAPGAMEVFNEWRLEKKDLHLTFQTVESLSE